MNGMPSAPVAALTATAATVWCVRAGLRRTGRPLRSLLTGPGRA